ncbi:hypothetical protein COV15_03240 [Candidatus Woesearchaeota archaeon CG10_big_fil_rev_8_21_14_0_10_34_12]|nr:MAG: hypothetical protein COV15_03240 [Candidatus Woesearchaeota archaeon CG10_big_fil_rev_8_21_14_0_10_34_12]
MEEEKKPEKENMGGEKKEALMQKFEDRPKYIILEKTKALYLMLHSYLELFPKSEKFTLRSRIEEIIIDSIKLLVLQNYKQTDIERKELILEFLANLYLLETLLQQASIFKYLSFQGFDRSVSLLREINNYVLARYKNLGGKHECT